MKKIGGLFLRIFVSLAAMAGLLYALRGKFGEAFLILKGGIHWGWFALAILAYFAALAFISWRLQLVFRVQGVKVNFSQSLYLSFLGHFFTLFFPSALGGDIAKGYFAYQYSGKKLGSLTGVVLDRLLGFMTLIVIAVLVLGFYSQGLATPLVARSLYMALGVLIFGTAFFASRRFAKRFHIFSFLVPSAKWREKLSDLYHAIRNLQHHKKIFLSCLAISIAAQFVFFCDAFFLSQSLGAGVSLWPFIVLMPLVAFVSMAPSLSGLGVREAGFVFFFKSFMPAEKALALALLYDIIFYGVSLLAGLVFAFRGGLRKETIHDLEKIEVLEEVG